MGQFPPPLLLVELALGLAVKVSHRNYPAAKSAEFPSRQKLPPRDGRKNRHFISCGKNLVLSAKLVINRKAQLLTATRQ